MVHTIFSNISSSELQNFWKSSTMCNSRTHGKDIVLSKYEKSPFIQLQKHLQNYRCETWALCVVLGYWTCLVSSLIPSPSHFSSPSAQNSCGPPRRKLRITDLLRASLSPIVSALVHFGSLMRHQCIVALSSRKCPALLPSSTPTPPTWYFGF